MAEQSFEKHARFVPAVPLRGAPPIAGVRVRPSWQKLTRRVLEGELTDRRSIKRAVTRWRADHQRI